MIVPHFEYDLFISYAHTDNIGLDERDPGWVNEFRDALARLLNVEMRAEPRIWMDDAGLTGQAVHSGISDAIRKSAILLVVVSRAWLKSEYCGPKELEPFTGVAHAAFPLVMDTMKRIVVIGYDTETDAPRSTWPEVLRDAPFVSFCSKKPDGRRHLVRKPSQHDPEHQYWARLNDSVQHLAAILNEMQQRSAGDQVALLTPPTTPVRKSPAAWRTPWSSPVVYVRHTGIAQPELQGLAKTLFDKDCEVLYPERQAEEANKTYLRNADGTILFFDCGAIDSARRDALSSREVALEHGRPKLVGILANAECLQDFHFLSRSIVPMRRRPSGEIEGLDQFLSALRDGRA